MSREAAASGRLIVLPYIGGEQCMRQKTHDLIATSSNMGHTDIILTRNCTTNWPKIQRSLLLLKTAEDRPDLCAQVFNLKLIVLMETIIRDKNFGKVVSHVSLIEFKTDSLHSTKPRRMHLNSARVDTVISGNC